MSDWHNIVWPWAVGGDNDGISIPKTTPEQRSFQAIYGAPKAEPDPSDMGKRIAPETFTLRKMGMPGSGLRVSFFALEGIPDIEACALVWERICQKLLEISMAIGSSPQSEDKTEQDKLIGALREAAVPMKWGEGQPPNPELAGQLAATAKVLSSVPCCPVCQGWLIYRRPDQRFMGDNNYVQCPSGHVFELVLVNELPGGITASEIIKRVIEDNAPQLRI